MSEAAADSGGSAEAVAEVLDAHQGGEEATEIGESEEQAPEALEGAEAAEGGEDGERFTIKVDGEEKAVTLDELRTMAQKGAGAERKFEEAAKLRKQYEAEVAQLRKELGGDPLIRAYLTGGREAVLAALVEDLEFESLPEEEREKRTKQRELEEKARRAEEYEKRERERLEAQQAEQMQGQIVQQMTSALEAVGVGAKPAAIRRMAILAEAAVEERANVTMEQLAEQVRDEMRGDLGSWLPEDPDALVELLGDERMKLLREREAARLKSRTADISRTKPKPNGERKPRPKRGVRTVGSDFWRSLGD